MFKNEFAAYRRLSWVAQAAGAAVIAWSAGAHALTHPLSAAFAVLIGGFYALGLWDLARHARQWQQLDGLLAEPLSSTHTFSQSLPGIDRLHRDWAAAVERRLAGRAGAWPLPVLPSAIAGLLVLLGMLGTFVGMVATLRGTLEALGASADLTAVRVALSAPVQGLGVAFGASVAGVAASAALGLALAIQRLHRQSVLRALERAVTHAWYPWTSRAAHERQLAAQAEAQALAEAQRSEAAALAQQTQRQLQEQAQERDHQRWLVLQQVLQTTLAQGLPQALAPLLLQIGQTMSGFAEQSSKVLQSVDDAQQRQAAQAHSLQRDWSSRLEAQWRATVDGVLRDLHTQMQSGLRAAQDASDQHLQKLAQFWEQHAQQHAQQLSATATEAMQRSVQHTADVLQEHGKVHLQSWHEQAQSWAAEQRAVLAALADSSVTAVSQQAQAMMARGEAQVERTLDAVQALSEHLALAPQTAAIVMESLQQQFSDHLRRDSEQVGQRELMLQRLQGVVAALERDVIDHRATLDDLTAGAQQALQSQSVGFAENAAAVVVATQLAAQHLQQGTLGLEALQVQWTAALAALTQSQERVLERLAAVESGLGESTQRSQEQLAYTVAQAREVIDLTLLSQRQLLEELRRLEAA